MAAKYGLFTSFVLCAPDLIFCLTKKSFFLVKKENVLMVPPSDGSFSFTWLDDVRRGTCFSSKVSVALRRFNQHVRMYVGVRTLG